jgi:S-adenosylmethionine synthetase
MTLTIEALADTPVARRRVELVERKGLGHPDTLCDALVEAIALALNRLYLAETGSVQHYNVDKALLAAGQAEKTFGAGRLTRPITLVVGDRATVAAGGRRLPVEAAAEAAVAAWLGAHLPRVRAGAELRVESRLAPGSEELRGLFAGPPGPVSSNDTSGASGYAPLTPTERLVLDVEGWLNGPAFKAAFPDTGQDVKVFAFREDDRVAVTIAMPFLCEAVPAEAAYFRRKAEVVAALAARFPPAAAGGLAVAWGLNCLDAPGRGSAGAYLSVTGTSAEDADSGQVGRGNRANGLIALSRPGGSEAAPGKNAVAHAGKIYSVLSHRLAGLVHAGVPGLAEVVVHLAARIGDPVDRPRVAVQLVLAPGARPGDVEPAVREVVEAELARLPAFRAELARGEHPVC